ncbi:cystatin-M [Erinaceus europaeus]|uniref:Cystatin-M n=1 Tax=Erinaceus europaeus TaxID=9365 RepID=A0A1S2ZFR4_ERIEU|nr:cystatin-M [Erinaceus europaeus]
MAPSQLPLALGLALLAACVLALSGPGERREHLVGGRQELSPDDPQVQKVADAAVASYNMGSNSALYYRGTNVLRAESQLVAGIKYFLTVDMGSTSCRKTAMTGDRSVDLTTCPLAADGEQEKLRCDFEILVVPWKNSSQLIKQDCVSL